MVDELQAVLNAKYGFSLDVDGSFGADTEAAVKAFQKSKGLTVDGIVGPKTWKALGLKSANAENTIPSPDKGENLPAQLPGTTLPGVEMVAVPLADWQAVRAGVMAAYHVLQNYE